MPSKPSKPCGVVWCPEVVPAGQRYCEKHQKQVAKKYDDNRLTATERGYNGNWHKVRGMKLAQDPLCERCLSKGIVIQAALIHHKDRNPRHNEMRNLESLCVACHDVEHKRDRFIRKTDKP